MTEITQDEITQEQYQKFFDEFEKVYKEYESKVKERRARGIHDYNVFDVLETKEVKHSKFIASLLDPKGLHYQGDLFLREFINACGISDFGLDISNTQVCRESNNIDIYITDGNKHIIIENKLWTGDHDKQVARYIQIIADKIEKGVNKQDLKDRILVLYLTPKSFNIEELGGIKTIEKDCLITKKDYGGISVKYKHITYENEILNWLNAIKAEIINLTDLNVLITQYEKAVKKLTNQGEKMENDKVKEQIKQNYELCATIYDEFKNVEKDWINDFLEKVFEILKEEIKNIKFKKFKDKNTCVIEIKPQESCEKYFRFVVERKTNEILYGFLKNIDKIDLKNLPNIKLCYYNWYLENSFEKKTPREFIQEYIQNGAENYAKKIKDTIDNFKDELKKINEALNQNNQ